MAALNPVRLPVDAVISCFSFLSARDLCACRGVNSQFRQVMDDSEAREVWAPSARNALQRFGFDGGELKVPEYRQFLQQLESQHLRSDAEILAAFQGFLNRISLGQHARFTCLIRGGAIPHMISIEINTSTDPHRSFEGVPMRAEEGDLHIPYECRHHLRDIDLQEDYVAPNGISGNMVLQEGVFGEFMYARDWQERLWITHQYNPFTAVLRFPRIGHVDDRRHPIELGMQTMAVTRIGQLANESSQENCKRISLVVAGVAAVAGIGVSCLMM